MNAVTPWEPDAPIALLRRRAELLHRVRAFFLDRGLLEVETPYLSSAAATDPALESLRAAAPGGGAPVYLHTSPEFPMKRLLAAGSGPIWQICRVFRGGESGRLHNPEFSMLEWYRPDWDHHRLMAEVAELLQVVVGAREVRIRSYAELFAPLDIDPHEASSGRIAAAAARRGVEAPPGLDRDGLLDLLLSHVLAPDLGRTGALDFVHGFPASQASLARLEPGEPPIARRFECFLEGMEVANGYHELADAGEQRQRFEADLALRRARGVPVVPVDERLLAALAHGLPDCAGVAVGLDRLFMVALGATWLRQVMAFSFARS